MTQDPEFELVTQPGPEQRYWNGHLMDCLARAGPRRMLGGPCTCGFRAVLLDWGRLAGALHDVAKVDAPDGAYLERNSDQIAAAVIARLLKLD